MSCSEVNRSVTSATFSGIANGASGLLGMSGFWSPTDSSGLDEVTAQLNTLKDKWNNIIGQEQNQLTDSQTQFAQEQQQFLIATQAFRDEIMDDKIETNTLLIQIITGILLIVIIYLIIL